MTNGKAGFLLEKPKPRCAPAIIDKSQSKKAIAVSGPSGLGFPVFGFQFQLAWELSGV
jgi:hypothetical protein